MIRLWPGQGKMINDCKKNEKLTCKIKNRKKPVLKEENKKNVTSLKS